MGTGSGLPGVVGSCLSGPTDFSNALAEHRSEMYCMGFLVTNVVVRYS